MDRICKNEIRLVEMKGELMIIKLVKCGSCEGCKPKPIELVDLAESDMEDDDIVYSPYTRWLNGRFIHIREIIQID